MFHKDSVIVRIWVDAIKRGDKTIEDVPQLSNLIEIVTTTIKGDV